MIKGRSDIFQISLIVIIVILSRLPFLSAGYGTDVDAWRVVSVAREIAQTSQFVYSRVPGHPFHEIICSLFWNRGPLWLNGATAVMSILAVVFFMFILRHLHFKNIYLPTLAFALTPVIYINSVNSLEHVWALAFILGSMYFALSSKPVTAGIFLGLANGCRLPSILMLIPLAMLLYHNSSGKKIRNLLRFVLTAGVVTLILFLPLYLRFDLFNVYAGSYPGFIYILFRIFIAIWGFMGLVAILAAGIIQSVYFIKSREHNSPRVPKRESYFDSLLLTGVMLFIIAFLLLPHKAAYLIPVVPLFLILLGRFLKRTLFDVVCVFIIISPFLLGVNRTDLNVLPDFSKYSIRFSFEESEIVFDLLNGPVLSEHSKRIKQLELTDKIITQGELLIRKSVVLVGESFPLIDVTLPYNQQGDVIIQGNVIYEYALDSAKLNFYSAREYDIYYLPGEEGISLALYQVDLKAIGAKDLFAR